MNRPMVLTLLFLTAACGKQSPQTGDSTTPPRASTSGSATSAPADVDAAASSQAAQATQALDAAIADAGPSVPFEVAALVAGTAQTCARSTGGKTRCWGDTGFLTMADGASNQQRARPTLAPALDRFAEIALGHVHGCARTKEGSVACWGIALNGLLGDGKPREGGPPSGGGGGRRFCTGDHERCVPEAVAGLGDVAQIAAGPSHTCARLTGGKVRCWGKNDGGQLGEGTTNTRYAPSPVSGLKDGVVEIAAGFSHTCARHKDGTLSCWGANGSGQLGDGSTTYRKEPVAVAGLNNVAQVACGGFRSCARLTDGTVSCWGKAVPKPDAVPGLAGVADVVVGREHVCVRQKDGAVLCWGENGSGQLGDGTTEKRATPVRVASLTGATHLALGDWHTCAAVAQGRETWCWGKNGNHELGDGTTEDRRTPVRIVYP